MKKKICKNCYYFVSSHAISGNCHFNAPFIAETYYDESAVGKGDARGYYIARSTEWPAIDKHNFCGQWKDRNEKTS
jgi:hypothetical protein